MSTKYANNPTANLFELLQVDNDLPEKRANKTQAKKPVDASSLVETPAEKGQRRKALEAQKAAAAAADKQRRDAEEAMAALIPQEGFQVQKGSQPKKPSEAKGKLLNREQFNEKPEGQSDKKPFVRGPGPQRKFDERKPGEKGAHPHRDDKRVNTNRPPRHEGYDKHSGGKTTNKPPAKRRGEGAGNWGEPVSNAALQGAWDEPTASAPTDAQGWGDEKTETKVQTTNAQGWDDGEKKAEKSEKKEETTQDDRKREPAWDDEGFGKMTLQDFQKTIAAERAAALEKLNVGVKAPGRQVENAVDLSKCSYRDTTDEKEKKLFEDRKKQIAEEKKKRGQQRAGTTNVDLTDYLEVRSRGGRGGRGGGRGGDRPPRQDKPEGEQQQSAESRPARGGRGGGGRGGNRVPKNAFPELVPAAPAATAPKSTK